MPTARSCQSFARPMLSLLALTVIASVASAQLKPGTFLATTWGFQNSPAGHGLFAVDPWTRSSTRLNVAGLPNNQSLGSGQLLILSSSHFLVGVTNSNTGLGDVWEVTWSRVAGWLPNKLTWNQIPSPGPFVAVGTELYILANPVKPQQTCLCAKLYRVPLSGGVPTLEVDLSLQGVTGFGSAMVAVGSSLHVFTFDTSPSTTSNSGHWRIGTSSTPPSLTKLPSLPRSNRSPLANRKFAAVGAVIDPRDSNGIVIASRWGDVLRRDFSGNDIDHLGLPTPFTGYVNAMAVNTDTDALVFGDLAGNYEEWRDPNGSYLVDFVSILATAQAQPWVTGLAHVPALPKYRWVGSGCDDSRGFMPTSYATELPSAPSTTFTFTVDSPARGAVLMIGAIPYTYPGLDLGPIGAPGCFVHINPIISVGASTDPRVPLALPAGWRGVTAYTQWWLPDPSNPLGGVLSDARRLEIR